MVEFNTILSFIQASGIIVGVAYYIMNIQNSQKNQELTLETRQASLHLYSITRDDWVNEQEYRKGRDF